MNSTNDSSNVASLALQQTITMTPCDSSNVEAYGYDWLNGVLAVRFRGKDGAPGPLYHYRSIGNAEWQAFQDAPSKGSYLQTAIKPHPQLYPVDKVIEPAQEPAGE